MRWTCVSPWVRITRGIYRCSSSNIAAIWISAHGYRATHPPTHRDRACREALYLLDNDRRGLDCWGHRRATPSDLIELRRAGARVTGVPGVWLARLATGLPEFVISVYGAAHPGRD